MSFERWTQFVNDYTKRTAENSENKDVVNGQQNTKTGHTENEGGTE